MSIDPTPPTPPATPPSTGAVAAMRPDTKPEVNEIKVVAHSGLFYWWPVWAFGFLFGFISLAAGTKTAPVPDNSEFKQIEGNRYELIVPAAKDPANTWKPGPPDYFKKAEGVYEPRAHVSRISGLGPIFVIILLLVILITNIPLRGLWSFIVIGSLITLSLLFQLMGWWDNIFAAFKAFHVTINASGYLVFSTVLFVMWLLVVNLFDTQTYFIFTPGQIRVKQEIGDGEKTYDSIGASTEKKRDDLFRHWVLGLGTGDLIVKTSGANAQELELRNVLGISWKLERIQQMVRRGAVKPSA